MHIFQSISATKKFAGHFPTVTPGRASFILIAAAIVLSIYFRQWLGLAAVGGVLVIGAVIAIAQLWLNREHR